MPVLHHVGYAVASIAETLREYQLALGFQPAPRIFADPGLRVSVALLSAGNGAFIEFIEPLGHPSPIDEILRLRRSLYHVCYEVPDIHASLARLHAAGGSVISPPQPAVAFDGRLVAFSLTTGNHIIEFLQATKPALCGSAT